MANNKPDSLKKMNKELDDTIDKINEIKKQWKDVINDQQRIDPYTKYKENYGLQKAKDVVVEFSPEYVGLIITLMEAKGEVRDLIIKSLEEDGKNDPFIEELLDIIKNKGSEIKKIYSKKSEYQDKKDKISAVQKLAYHTLKGYQLYPYIQEREE